MSMHSRSSSAISTPWSQVRDRLSCSGSVAAAAAIASRTASVPCPVKAGRFLAASGCSHVLAVRAARSADRSAQWFEVDRLAGLFAWSCGIAAWAGFVPYVAKFGAYTKVCDGLAPSSCFSPGVYHGSGDPRQGRVRRELSANARSSYGPG